MHLPVTTTLAVLTLTLMAGAAQAAPAPALDSKTNLVMTVADDSRGEDRAIEGEQGKLPNEAGAPADAPAATDQPPSGGNAEGKGFQGRGPIVPFPRRPHPRSPRFGGDALPPRRGALADNSRKFAQARLRQNRDSACMVKPAARDGRAAPARARGREGRETMPFPVRTSLAVLTFALFAATGANAAPRRAADHDTTLTIAQNESQEVEGEEGKDGQTPVTGDQDTGGAGGAMAVPAPATESAPNPPCTRWRRRG